MYSFYGGKQGRTYNIVERYDLIYIDLTDIRTLENPDGKLINFIPNQWYDFGSYLFYLSAVYLVLYQTEDIEDKIDTTTLKIYLTEEDLENPDLLARIKGMVNEFQKGGAYTDANYGLYVIIDTVLNLNHKNDDINGIIYRRGFDYTEPVVSYERPKKYDQALRIILQEIDGEKRTYTGILNVYHDYHLELDNNNNTWIPVDDGFNDARWVAAWRKYVLKPGGGAIYVGQIVGPQGDTPEIRGVSWEKFIDINEQAGDLVTHGIVTMTDTPGWSELDGYNDVIKTGYCNIKDQDNQLIGAYISFDIPETIFKVSAQGVDPYGDTPRDHYDIASGLTDLNISIILGIEHLIDSKVWKYEGLIHQHTESGVEAGHPFYYNFDIAVPNGIHGLDVELITKETVSLINAKLPAQDRIVIDLSNVHSDDYVASDDEYISYYTRHYNNSAAGDVSVPLGRWPYRVIKSITENLKQRSYFSNWGGLAVIGDLYILDESNDIMAICIDIEANTTGITGSEADFIAGYQVSSNLGTEIRSGETLWRVVKIPRTAAAASLLIDYTAGKNETQGIRLLDYFTVDNLGNLYAVYSDSDLLNYLTTLGSISEINLENSILTIAYQSGLIQSFLVKQIDSIFLENEDNILYPQRWIVNYKGVDSEYISESLNSILSIDRQGDNIIILYSDPVYRELIRSSGIVDVDYYLKDYTDKSGRIYRNLVWKNLGPLGAQYHVQGEYTLADLKTGGLLENGFTGALADRAGWIVSIVDNDIRSLYAYDYHQTHTWVDGTVSHWYKLKDMDSELVDPTVVNRISAQTQSSGLIYRDDNLNTNGLWFVVTGGHDNPVL